MNKWIWMEKYWPKNILFALLKILLFWATMSLNNQWSTQSQLWVKNIYIYLEDWKQETDCNVSQYWMKKTWFIVVRYCILFKILLSFLKIAYPMHDTIISPLILILLYSLFFFLSTNFLFIIQILSLITHFKTCRYWTWKHHSSLPFEI